MESLPWPSVPTLSGAYISLLSQLSLLGVSWTRRNASPLLLLGAERALSKLALSAERS